MVVGFLGKGKCYRAPCRWYADGPIGTIEYYYAEPDAKYFLGDHVFFPLGAFGADGVEGGDVGELTGQRVYYNGVFNDRPAGVGYAGELSDFTGRNPYPGPEVEPNCHPAPILFVEQLFYDATTDVEIVSEPPVIDLCELCPDGSYETYKVTLSGLKTLSPDYDQYRYNGTWTLTYHSACTWRYDDDENDIHISLGRSWAGFFWLRRWTLSVMNTNLQFQNVPAEGASCFDDAVLTKIPSSWWLSWIEHGPDTVTLTH